MSDAPCVSTPEDRRAAVAIQVSLSSNVISGALAVIAAEVALVTFILDKRELRTGFTVAAVVGFASLLASVIAGSKGISEAYKSGHGGLWRSKSEKGRFGMQTLLAYAGVLCVASLILLTSEKTDSPRPDRALSESLPDQKLAIDNLSAANRELSMQVQTLQAAVQSLRAELSKASRSVPRPTLSSRPKSP